MGGNHRHEQRVLQISAHPLGGEAGMQFHPLGRAGAQRLGLPPRHMVVGDIGKLGKDREGADQQHDVRLAQVPQQLARNLAGAPARRYSPTDWRRMPSTSSKACCAMLFADDLAQQPAQQADGSPVLAR